MSKSCECSRSWLNNISVLICASLFHVLSGACGLHIPSVHDITLLQLSSVFPKLFSPVFRLMHGAISVAPCAVHEEVRLLSLIDRSLSKSATETCQLPVRISPSKLKEELTTSCHLSVISTTNLFLVIIEYIHNNVCLV